MNIMREIDYYDKKRDWNQYAEDFLLRIWKT